MKVILSSRLLPPMDWKCLSASWKTMTSTISTSFLLVEPFSPQYHSSITAVIRMHWDLATRWYPLSIPIAAYLSFWKLANFSELPGNQSNPDNQARRWSNNRLRVRLLCQQPRWEAETCLYTISLWMQMYCLHKQLASVQWIDRKRGN